MITDVKNDPTSTKRKVFTKNFSATLRRHSTEKRFTSRAHLQTRSSKNGDLIKAYPKNPSEQKIHESRSVLGFSKSETGLQLTSKKTKFFFLKVFKVDVCCVGVKNS